MAPYAPGSTFPVAMLLLWESAVLCAVWGSPKQNSERPGADPWFQAPGLCGGHLDIQEWQPAPEDLRAIPPSNGGGLRGALCQIPLPRKAPSMGRSDPGPRPPTPHSCQARLAGGPSLLHPCGLRECPVSWLHLKASATQGGSGLHCDWPLCPCLSLVRQGLCLLVFLPPHSGGSAATWLGRRAPADVLSGLEPGAGPLCRPGLIFRPWAD